MLEFYYKKSEKKVPCVKHSKKVTCGEWNHSDLLCTGSDDKMLIVSDMLGNSVVETVLLPVAPIKIVW